MEELTDCTAPSTAAAAATMSAVLPRSKSGGAKGPKLAASSKETCKKKKTQMGGAALQHQFSGKSTDELVKGDHVSVGGCGKVGGWLAGWLAGWLVKAAGGREGGSCRCSVHAPDIPVATRLLTRGGPSLLLLHAPLPAISPTSHPALLPAAVLQPWSGVGERVLQILPPDWRTNIQQAFSSMGEALGKLMGGGQEGGRRVSPLALPCCGPCRRRLLPLERGTLLHCFSARPICRCCHVCRWAAAAASDALMRRCLVRYAGG